MTASSTPSALLSLVTSAKLGGNAVEFVGLFLGMPHPARHTTAPFSIVVASSLSLLALFFKLRRYELLLGGQITVTVSILFGLVSMNCPIFQWIWVYSGVVSSAVLVLVLVRYWMAREARTNTVSLSSYVLPLEKEFEVPVRIIDIQKIGHLPTGMLRTSL